MDTIVEHSPAAADMATETKERFIPVDRDEILEKLLDCGIWPDHETSRARTVLTMIARLRQQDSCLTMDRMSSLYDPFNPDDETVNTAAPDQERRAAQLAELIGELRKLFEGANYASINEKQLEKILAESSPAGVSVDVDLTDFDFTLLYSRGQTTETRERRDWDTFFLKKEFEVDLYRRFVMAIKLKPDDVRLKEIMQKEEIGLQKAEKRLARMRADLPKGATADKIYIKMFKYIPRQDLEMLFPNTKIKLKYWDKVRLWITAGGTTLFGVVTTVVKIVTAVALSPVFVFMAFFGLGGVIFRQFMNLMNTRTKYMMQLAQNLYFHNLANNQSVIALLIDEAEEENIKEEMLLYTSLLKGSQTHGQLTRAKADIERFLEHYWGVKIDFDVHDALDRLREDGLVTEHGGGLLKVMPLDDAIVYLKDRWAASLNGLPAKAAA
ncbi:MAG: TMEM143 family protein [Hyphomicrobiales bacterium]|nr:TMEM143 family protein [Hyphomicrobiales bacterium]